MNDWPDHVCLCSTCNQQRVALLLLKFMLPASINKEETRTRPTLPSANSGTLIFSLHPRGTRCTKNEARTEFQLALLCRSRRVSDEAEQLIFPSRSSPQLSLCANANLQLYNHEYSITSPYWKFSTCYLRVTRGEAHLHIIYILCYTLFLRQNWLYSQFHSSRLLVYIQMFSTVGLPYKLIRFSFWCTPVALGFSTLYCH